MKTLLLLFLALIGTIDLPAQDSTYVTIKAGNRIRDVLAPADIYFYPQFTTGQIVFKEGKRVVVDMNYTRLFDQMLYINQKGDTLALADEKTIKFIAILKDTFYYDDGYIRIITDNDFVKFAEKQVWVVADIRKIGTHNRPSNTVAITSLTAYTDGTDAAKSKDLMLNEDIVLRKEIQYYFGNAYNHFVRAGKKKIQGLFPKEEMSIENYLKKNKVNFDKKEDLEKLAQFLSDQY
jgi:hypothetical protein